MHNFYLSLCVSLEQGVKGKRREGQMHRGNPAQSQMIHVLQRQRVATKELV